MAKERYLERKFDEQNQTMIQIRRESARVALESAEMDSSESAVDDLLKRVDFYNREYENGSAEIADMEVEWEEIEELYKKARLDRDESTINAKVNVILPNIEGQVSSMVNTTISGNYKPKGVSDYKWASTAGAIGEKILEENNIKRRVKDGARSYLKIGFAMGMVVWDYKKFNGMGLPMFKMLPRGSVVVDRKIKNMEESEGSDYMIREVGIQSIMQAYDLFGEKIADSIQRGNQAINDTSTRSHADNQGYTLMEAWTKVNEYDNLQLIEFTPDGIVLSVSNPKEPYYKYVDNEYPIKMVGLYTTEGEFYPFGDGYALRDIQLLINKIYDEIILSMKYSSHGRTFAALRSRLSIKKFKKNDPGEPLFVTSPGLIKTERGTGVHEVVFRLLEQLFQKVQEVTRFSALMSGTSPGETMTATQAGIQMQQGIAGIDDKRADLSRMYGDMLNYGIGMCMEFWTKGEAFRVVDDPDKFQWVDARELSRVPVLKPAETEFLERYKKRNPKRTAPKFQVFQSKDDKGKVVDVTRRLGLDVEVSIGQGLPSNKITLYNLIIQLAQLQLIDERTGQPRSLMSYDQAQKMISDILGIKFGDVFADKDATRLNVQNTMVQQAARVSPINQDANVPNANTSGVVGGAQRVV